MSVPSPKYVLQVAFAYLDERRRAGAFGRVRAWHDFGKSKMAVNRKEGYFILDDCETIYSGQMFNIDSEAYSLRTQIDERGGLELGFIW